MATRSAGHTKTACADCGSKLGEGSQFCPFCGSVAAVVVSAPRVASDPAPASSDPAVRAPDGSTSGVQKIVSQPAPVAARTQNGTAARTQNGTWLKHVDLNRPTPNPGPNPDRALRDTPPAQEVKASSHSVDESIAEESQRSLRDEQSSRATTPEYGEIDHTAYYQRSSHAQPKSEKPPELAFVPPDLGSSGVRWRATRLVELVAESARQGVSRARDRLSDPSGFQARATPVHYGAIAVVVVLVALAAITALYNNR